MKKFNKQQRSFPNSLLKNKGEKHLNEFGWKENWIRSLGNKEDDSMLCVYVCCATEPN